MELPDIASIRFRSQIDATCKEIRERCGIDYIIVYVIFKNGLFVLSNIYSHLNDYYHNRMFQHDSSTSKFHFDDKNYYLCENDKGITPEYSKLLRNTHGVHRAFYKIFHTDDFKIILGAASNHPIDNKADLYNSVSKNFDKFAFKFVQENIDVFKSNNPELKKSPYFRNDRTLKNLLVYSDQASSLSPRERECLRFAAHGYTADETGLELDISKFTVEDHKKSAMTRLGAVNMNHAIHIATKRNLLGDDGPRIIVPNVNEISEFRNIHNKTNR